jgi:hypothetical protein
MAGTRDRCFYCSDSRGTDVDHYIPIAHDYAQTFLWRNHLWACADCNRRKAMRFPVGPAGEPLVIDPTRTDPWQHLVLADTGVVAPKYHPGEVVDPHGETTLEVLNRMNHEAVIEGRHRVIRRFRRAVEDVVANGETPARWQSVIEEARDDDFGVAWWYLRWEGSLTSPFADFRRRHEPLWRRVSANVVARQHGP